MSSEGRQWCPLGLQQGKPYSARFGDVYYSGEGVAETSHVFLAPCRLAERFSLGARVVVGELGFGTALNFLGALKCFRECASRDAHLEYFSCERYPLSAEDLLSACPDDPELKMLAHELCAQYPQHPSGVHECFFDDDRVRLTLVFDDVHEALPLYPPDVDAWFLDGFAPDRNAAMWDDLVIAGVAEHSAPNSRVSTYTAVGAVKRRLRDVGFEVERRDGYGTKRHMLVGTYVGLDGV